MSKLQPYKIVNENGFEVFFGDNTGSGSPKSQVDAYIARNNGKTKLKLYWRDVHSENNWGWKFQGSF